MVTAGVQISSLKPYLQTPAQLEETFQRLRDIGCRIVVEQTIEILGLVNLEVLVEFSDIGGMEISEFPDCLLLVVGMDYPANMLEIFGSIFLH